ncbi:UNKNOWN [Stylonychia lemnae]|uniref:Uncharacterized protein n=1 Tax=Stylonychia lemnae TaxID=5949 RepID=A0A078AZR7_STYLE|nr:UNKNOWN [Stylonychia lemnae]|eukprot:CDW86293.1 UNKNOWN [Stylonychia lemnae]
MIRKMGVPMKIKWAKYKFGIPNSQIVSKVQVKLQMMQANRISIYQIQNQIMI